MKAPSLRNLETTFRLDRASARTIRDLCKHVDNPARLESLINDLCPDTAAYVRQMYSSPYNSGMWRRTVALHAIDRILGTYGVEALSPEGEFSLSAPPYEYCNAGDTYATTLIYHRAADALRIGSWGDIAERFPSAAE